MTSNLVFIIAAMLFVVVSNTIMYQLIMHKAKTRIKEDLETLGLTLIDVRRTGWFNRGNFDDDIFEGGPYRKGGNFKSIHYRNVDFKDSFGKMRTSTVKIKWHLLKRTQLEFKPDLKKQIARHQA